ncbi:MAG: hypothetical protein JNL08_17065 [Planctomycetes bacterium]|nr:hypothetical protein [Planctomycetota bacterium]
MHRTVLRQRSLPFLLLAAAACTATRQQQLESVAKDWCQSIRASQVMPVYPLTQDLQPGDVFLVRTPIDQQQREWEQNGYLPLDNHLARLDPTGYAEFYRSSFPQPANLPLGHLHAQPPWSTAPHAGFPTYGFSVQRGGGLNLALPVSGVPVGLGLLGASSAEGTISIGKARTLGVDLVSLDGQLRGWAQMPANRAFLAGLASTGTRRNYVRVVTRVYLTGELDVSLRDTTDRSAGLDIGVPSPVAALVPKVAAEPAATTAAAAENYKAAIEALNGMLKSQDRVTTDAQGKPVLGAGGSLRLVAATARTVAMKESFDPPLVLGYLGFDCEIGPAGELGPAVPTLAVVSGRLGGEAFLARAPVTNAWLGQFWLTAYELATARAGTDEAARAAVAAADALGRFVPPQWTTWQWTPTNRLVEATASPSEPSPYRRFRQYVANSEASAQDIATALAQPTFQLERGGAPVDVARDSDDARRLAAMADGLRFQLSDQRLDAAHAEARRRLADWLFARLYAAPQP